MKNKGFTLIELLVVIAIIGVLASIISFSIRSAREKGSNAAVKANLAGIRSQGEIVYGDNGQSYDAVCSDTGVITAINSALTAGGDTGTVATRCNSIATEWAANVLLKTPEGSDNYWCVDSSGKSKGEADELAGGTSCP